MQILIIGAMNEEVDRLRSLANTQQELIHSDVRHWVGNINQHNVIICQSGIGKVNSTVTTTVMLHHYKPDLVINIGSAGGIGQDINIADIIVATDLTYHDVDVTAFSYTIGQVPEMPETYKPSQTFIEMVKDTNNELAFKYGLVVSGDSFINSKEKIQSIKSNFPSALALDMESTAIAQTCYKLKTQFMIFRTISDHADYDSNTDFSNQLKKVSDQLATQLVNLIKNF